MFRPHMLIGRLFSYISLELTVPTGREYIPGVVKWGDSSVGAGFCGVPEKENSYLGAIDPAKAQAEAKLRADYAAGAASNYYIAKDGGIKHKRG